MPDKPIKSIRLQEMQVHGTRLFKEEIKVIEELLLKYPMNATNTTFKDYCLAYLEKKLRNKPLRAYFSLKIYEYLKHCFPLNKRIASDDALLYTNKLPFVFEVIITIQYLHNHILDEKMDTQPMNYSKINQNLIASNILRALLFRYMEQEIAPCIRDKKRFRFLQDKIRELFLVVDIGQYIDKNHNTYKSWKANKQESFDDGLFDKLVQTCLGRVLKKVRKDVPDKKNFIQTYFYRIYCSNVYFFRCMTEIICGLLEVRNGPHFSDLKHFSTYYGFMLQVINDYADFAYSDNKKEQKILKSTGKKTTDFFADLYNHNITLPLIYHLKEKQNRKIELYLEGGKRSRRIIELYPNQVKKEIYDSGAIHACIDISKMLSKFASIHLDANNPISPFLKDMCDMANDNKFYNVFRQRKKITTMDFTKSDALFTPSQLCEAFAEAAQTYALRPIEAMIMTFWGSDQGIIRAYAHNFGSTKAQGAIDYINASADTKPVTKETLESPSPVFDGKSFFSLRSYFDKNDANPLVKQEKAYLEQRDYNLDEGYYSVIPFPNETLPNALVFLIAHDKAEAESFRDNNMQSSILGSLKKQQ